MGEEAVKMTEEEAGRRLMPDNHDDHDDHFVLVHGISGGSWCWYKIRCLLENSGYKVSSIDLKASGIDPSHVDTILSFQDYNKPVMDFMSSLPHHHKVILVGHSAGGLSITEATHKFGEKIRLAIYLGATMLKTGFSTEQDVKDVFAGAEMKLKNFTHSRGDVRAMMEFVHRRRREITNPSHDHL